jgi:hypothetical protein
MPTSNLIKLISLVALIFCGWLAIRSENKWIRSGCGFLAGLAFAYLLLAPRLD